eukprot:849714-Amphidinium_carterae.1
MGRGTVWWRRRTALWCSLQRDVSELNCVIDSEAGFAEAVEERSHQSADTKKHIVLLSDGLSLKCLFSMPLDCPIRIRHSDRLGLPLRSCGLGLSFMLSMCEGGRLLCFCHPSGEDDIALRTWLRSRLHGMLKER